MSSDKVNKWSLATPKSDNDSDRKNVRKAKDRLTENEEQTLMQLLRDLSTDKKKIKV